jgi:hypothetical protein
MKSALFFFTLFISLMVLFSVEDQNQPTIGHVTDSDVASTEDSNQVSLYYSPITRKLVKRYPRSSVKTVSYDTVVIKKDVPHLHWPSWPILTHGQQNPYADKKD